MRSTIMTAVLLALFGLSTAALAGDLYGRATPQTKARQAAQQMEEARIKAVQAQAAAEIDALRGTAPSGWATRAASPGRRSR